MLIGIQIVSARGLLNISQEKLAEDTGISLSTIKKMEKNRYGVYGTVERAMKLQKFFTNAGIVFINNDKEIGCVLIKSKSKHFSEEEE